VPKRDLEDPPDCGTTSTRVLVRRVKVRDAGKNGRRPPSHIFALMISTKETRESTSRISAVTDRPERAGLHSARVQRQGSSSLTSRLCRR
jgi:hypothetical protein